MTAADDILGSRVAWNGAVRIIQSAFPPVDFFVGSFHACEHRLDESVHRRRLWRALRWRCIRDGAVRDDPPPRPVYGAHGRGTGLDVAVQGDRDVGPCRTSRSSRARTSWPSRPRPEPLPRLATTGEKSQRCGLGWADISERQARGSNVRWPILPGLRFWASSRPAPRLPLERRAGRSRPRCGVRGGVQGCRCFLTFQP